ncbi:MAG TPA: MFS transporter [Candidatus Binatia bacterium]|nr:MFS transporter [Candidatus Binatia bacterium]
MTSSQDESPPRRRHRWLSLSVASLATLLVTADTGQLSIALPAIIAEFDADLTLASWIALVYALVTASLYLPCGRLSDLVGIGKVFRAGFFLYAASALAAGWSQSAEQLILFRALQAAGSALIMANNFALVTALFPPQERGRAMGISGGTISALGYTLGPVLGGVLTYAFGWRSNLYVSAALAFAGLAAARYLLPPESFKGRSGKIEPFDFPGMIAFALSISLLLLALATAQKGDWRNSLIGAEFLAGFGALGLFVWLERRARFPLLDLALFRIPAFTLGNSARWISFVAMSINVLLMPFFLQLGMRLDPLQAGLLVVPTPFAMALLAPLTGWMSERFLPERLCSLGLIISALAFLGLSFLSLETTALTVILWLSVLGLGMGLFQTPNNNLLMSSLPRQRLGVGSSFLSIVRSLGNSMGAALAATLVSAQLLAVTGHTSLQHLGPNLNTEGGALMLAAFLQGFHYTYLVAAALCLVGAALSAVRVSERWL